REYADGEEVSGTIGIEGHAAGQERSDEVYVRQQREGNEETGVFGEQESCATNGLGEDGEGRPATDFAGQRGGGTQYSPQQAGQKVKVSSTPGRIVLEVEPNAGKVIRRGKLKVWSGEVASTPFGEAVEQARHYER